jgi:FkbM family methyltransferase
MYSIREMIKLFKRENYYALNELDKKLLYYLKYKNGFFVEAGANDGIKQSNTYYFEQHLNWRGLLIEPIPELADKCRTNRPKCIVENCALVSFDYDLETIEIQYCNLMSTIKGAFGNEKQEKMHIESGKKFLRNEEKVYTINVPARTLSWVLDKHKLFNVDLLSLDVEGYEVEVLKGINFDRHYFKYILIEVRIKDSIDEIIGKYYYPVADLHIDKSYTDILYQRIS